MPGAGSPRTLEIVHAGVAHRVCVKRVASARRLTLRVRAADGAVVLTMPLRASWTSARDFALRHAAWIGARLDTLPDRIPLVPGARIPLRDVQHLVTLDASALRRVRTASGEDGPELRVSMRESDPAGALLAYLKREARRDLEAATHRHAAKVGRSVARITLRDTHSRWGSCSSRGSLNFSWRLILAPPPVLDYLAAHEVAHLVHLDHGEGFWAVTRRLAPQIDEAELWLKRHGPGLHRFAAARAEP